jgi:hypothetical protein
MEIIIGSMRFRGKLPQGKKVPLSETAVSANTSLSAEVRRFRKRDKTSEKRKKKKKAVKGFLLIRWRLIEAIVYIFLIS